MHFQMLFSFEANANLAHIGRLYICTKVDQHVHFREL